MKNLNGLNDAISNHACFHGMKPEHPTVLLDGAREAQSKEGDVLVRQGEPANQFHLALEVESAMEG